ncbi:putative serine protease K12H4.7 [Danaus plexippus plexippus]|uniref:Serine protease K12H4.7 n=1 Tax=Danaus plexippus plexippus TaxID=278856 RepID=A0A212FJC9_DANPL|nr:putative serine protease K12H4.7 [Danaus plexippus plexippus]
MTNMWLLLCLVTSAFSLKTLEPPPPEASARSSTNITEGWLPVRLNHFDASNTDTFQMRYYYNSQFSRGPYIVIFVGGEWSISPGWVRSGLAYELAERIGAGLFYTEHRYYGLTRPTNGTTVAEMRYLSVDQALGDLAQFIEYVRSDDFEGGRFRNARVALFGCSYAGSMATWMKLGYPHLVRTSLSDSGPLHAQQDFPEYLEVIATALRVQGSQQCVDDIESAMKRINELIETEAGLDTVSTLFNTCSRLRRSHLDLSTFFWYGITETFAYLVQYATPGDIPRACDHITNKTLGDPIERLSSWVTSQPYTQPCIESRYFEKVASHTNTSYDSPDATMRLWTYQTCTEYGWYQTTTSSRQPFLNTVPLEYFHQMCKDFFNDSIDENLLRSAIVRTNRLFAGLEHLPDGVLSVGGGHDPWSPVGPNKTHETHLAPVYVVDGVSHCRAIRPTGSSETEQLEITKQSSLLFMEGLMTDTRSSSAPLLASRLLVLALVILYATF